MTSLRQLLIQMEEKAELGLFNVNIISATWFRAIGPSARSQVNQNSKKTK